MVALPLVVGITGASGIVYGIRLVEALARGGNRVDLIVSDGARKVIEAEMGVPAREAFDAEGRFDAPRHLALGPAQLAQIRVFSAGDLAAPPASGTYKTRGMVVCPASMKTCAALAHGYSDNLIARAGEVALKERRPLVLVPRETPLSTIQLANFLELSRAGAVILPAMPGFYHSPQTIEDLVEFIVMKILDTLGISHAYPHAWDPDAKTQRRSKR